MTDSLLSTKTVECPQYLLDQAANMPAATTAVVNAGSKVVMQSTKMATDEGLITPILVGDTATIKNIAIELDWNISNVRLIQADNEEHAAATSVALAKGNEVASLMKGNIHTNNLLKAVINKELGLRTGRRLSHLFHMSLPNSTAAICITDAVINVAPNVKIKLDMARNAASLMHALGYEQPKIAVLSATEVATAAIPSSVEAKEVVQAGDVEGALLGGPFAFDNAVSPYAARLKGITDPVAGKADVLLVPNIETGNALFKQMVYFMGAAAAGVVLGATVPIILTSRADPAAARLASTALAAIYANNNSEAHSQKT